MGEYQHYNSFLLTNMKTHKQESLRDDYGGIIKNTNNTTYTRECLPEINMLTDKVNGMDGELPIKASYGTRILNFTLFFDKKESDGDLDLFKKWVGKTDTLYEFEYEDDWSEDKYLKNVSIYKGFESKVYYGKETEFNGEIELNFIAYDPFWYIRNERPIIFENLKVGDSKNIKNRGNVTSYPLINITPNSTEIIINWNGLQINLKNLIIGQTYIIDCKKEQFYYKTDKNIIVNCVNNYTSNVYFDYPYIDADLVNNFKIIKGDIRRLEINPISRII